jgi:hypothetical protein
VVVEVLVEEASTAVRQVMVDQETQVELAESQD